MYQTRTNRSRQFLETPKEGDSKPNSRGSTPRRAQRDVNPFKIPDTTDYFAIRDQDRENRDLRRARIANTPLQERNIQPNRPNIRKQYKIETTNPSPEESALAHIILAPQKGGTKTDLRDFIAQKREIFLSQLAIDTKREELQRLERLEIEEEKTLKEKEAEINLFKTQFTNFLEHDGKQTMLARQEAENKAKERIELSLQIKQISNEISSVRNEIAHQDERLAECEQYKNFLDSLTPEDWKKKHPNEVYFKDPSQLLTIIRSMEEQNMFLIRHCQEAEEMVERYRTKFTNLLEERDGAIVEKTEQLKVVSDALKQEQDKNRQYTSNKNFRTGAELTESQQAHLHDKIAKFYSTLGFDSTSTSDTVAMLVKMETLLHDLERELKDIDPVIVKKKAQERDAERREKLRLENQKKQKEIQYEKRAKTLALAKQPIKYKTGRPLVPRHIPKRGISKQEQEEQAKQAALEEAKMQELLYGDIWD